MIVRERGGHIECVLDPTGPQQIDLHGKVTYLAKPPDTTTLLTTLGEEPARRVIARGLVGLVARTEGGLLRAMFVTLRATRGRPWQSALVLGTPRTTLRDRMNAYRLESAAFKRPKT
jgi:DNA-binding NtrC family response regulator